jgi:hypothetical protein
MRKLAITLAVSMALGLLMLAASRGAAQAVGAWTERDLLFFVRATATCMTVFVVSDVAKRRGSKGLHSLALGTLAGAVVCGALALIWA